MPMFFAVDNMDKAVELWLKASEHRNGKAAMGRAERKAAYKAANELAGGNKKLMAELTKRGHISWAF